MDAQEKNYPDEVISAGQVLQILNADAEEISGLCQRACLKPKKDGFGNIYFSRSDIDVLRKVRELYGNTRKMENSTGNIGMDRNFEGRQIEASGGNIPARSENSLVLRKIDILEDNIVSKINGLLSEKLDGLDEVVVELIKAKTENEALRQKVNELNKENFALKSENSTYKPIALGLYVKKQTDDYTF